MQTNTPKIKGIAARAGHWSATHRKTAIWGWVAFLVVAMFVGQSVTPNQLKDSDSYAGESGRAEQTLAKAFKNPAGEMVLIQSSKTTADDPAFKAAVADVTRRVSKLKDVTERQVAVRARRFDLEGSSLRARHARRSRVTRRRPSTRSTRSSPR